MSYNNNKRWFIFFVSDEKDSLPDYIDTIFSPSKSEARSIFNFMVNYQKWLFSRKDGVYVLCDENDKALYECKITGEILH